MKTEMDEALLEGVDGDDESDNAAMEEEDREEAGDADKGEAPADDNPITDDDSEETDEESETSDEASEASGKLAGKTLKEAEKMYSDLEAQLGKQSNEVGELRKAVEALTTKKDDASDGDEGEGQLPELPILTEEDITDPDKVIAWYKNTGTGLLKHVEAVIEKKLGGLTAGAASGVPDDVQNSYTEQTAEFAKQHGISDDQVKEVNGFFADPKNVTFPALIAAYNHVHADKITLRENPAKTGGDGGSTNYGPGVSKRKIADIYNESGDEGLTKYLRTLKGRELEKAERIIGGMA
jgi:hypothetical protein